MTILNILIIIVAISISSNIVIGCLKKRKQNSTNGKFKQNKVVLSPDKELAKQILKKISRTCQRRPRVIRTVGSVQVVNLTPRCPTFLLIQIIGGGMVKEQLKHGQGLLIPMTHLTLFAQDNLGASSPDVSK